MSATSPRAPARSSSVARRVLRPLEQFLRVEAASGIVLLAASVAALVWANSPWAATYEHLWHAPITFGIGPWMFSEPLHFWINDGLMAVFFLVVGLEIRRELAGGELADMRRAALPVAGALGGVLVPAAIYLAFNAGRASQSGWAVPTATDIAFAVGVLALLGRRIAPPVRVFLLSLAIIDDVIAVLIIAVFYSAGIDPLGLGVAALGVLGVLSFQKLGVSRAFAYVLPGAVVWVGLLKAGVHPTLSGVLLGLLTPVRPMLDRKLMLNIAGDVIDELREKTDRAEEPKEILKPLSRMKHVELKGIAPVVRVEAALHPWVAYGIMPVFALANAGVFLGGVSFASGDAPWIGAGVLLGLLLGKPIGIVLVSRLALSAGLAALPRGMTFNGLAVVGCLGGIGFTMAIFIANLAYPNLNDLATAKCAVLASSALAAAIGVVTGWLVLPRPEARAEAR